MTKTTMKKATDEPDAVTDQPGVGSPAMIGPHRAVAVHVAQDALEDFMRDTAAHGSARQLGEPRSALMQGLMPLIRVHKKFVAADAAAYDPIGNAALVAATMAYAYAAMGTLSATHLPAPAAAAHGKALSAAKEMLEWALDRLSRAHVVALEGGAK